MMEGKTLTNASAIDRSKTDFYATPDEVTHALMKYLNLNENKKIWECACGNGAMAKVIMKYNKFVLYTDLYDQTCDFKYSIDFLDPNTYYNTDWIITNPPFKHAAEFIKKAWSLNKPFAFLLKSQYWHAKSRTDLFKNCKPSHVLALNWRPDFHFGSKGGSPTMECVWVVWDRKSDITIYDILERTD